MPHRPESVRFASERGVALILALLATLALTALTASLMLISRTETWSGMNYRLLAQTRYAAEAGMHQAVNYLLNSYTPPGGAADPLANYDTTASPVKYNGNPVVLSSLNGVASNYPVASVAAGFQAATPGTFTADTFTLNYATSATLVSLRQVTVYGSTTPVTIMTWQVTSDGSIPGPRNAAQEVSAILEQQFAHPFNYAVFTTSAGCNALAFSNGGTVDSFVFQGGSVVTQPQGGNVGTNGSVGASATATVDGSLSVPRAGVSACATQSQASYPTVTGGILELPQQIAYPPPSPPNPMPPTGGVSLGTGCGTLSPPACTLAADGVRLQPGSYADLTINGASLHLILGNYAINSLALTGNAKVTIDSGPPNSVVVNIAGQNVATPIDFTGGTVSNPFMSPSTLQIQYGGTGQINLTGGTQAAAAVYAPNASVSLIGGSAWFGSIVARTFDDPGGAAIHFDPQLAGLYSTAGNWALNSFTWKTY
jgi:hypothetical protein